MVHSVGTPRGYTRSTCGTTASSSLHRERRPPAQGEQPVHAAGDAKLRGRQPGAVRVAPRHAPRRPGERPAPAGRLARGADRPAPARGGAAGARRARALPPHTLREARNPGRGRGSSRAPTRARSTRSSRIKSCDFARTVLVPRDTAVSSPEGAKPAWRESRSTARTAWWSNSTAPRGGWCLRKCGSRVDVPSGRRRGRGGACESCVRAVQAPRGRERGRVPVRAALVSGRLVG